MTAYCRPAPNLTLVSDFEAFGVSTTALPPPWNESRALACWAPTRARSEKRSEIGNVPTRSRSMPCSLMRPSTVPAGTVVEVKPK